VTLQYPIADENKEVANLFDMIHPNADDTFTVRSVFIIELIRVKLILTYPASTGRNFDEILRVIDSLQLTAIASQPLLTGKMVMMLSFPHRSKTRIFLQNS
jgi:alkyl hydroperoxide reductase subunit AhpC